MLSKPSKFVRILKQVKPSTVSRVFTDLLSNSPKHLSRFSPGYESTENMFYFINKIQITTENETICSEEHIKLDCSKVLLTEWGFLHCNLTSKDFNKFNHITLKMNEISLY